MKCFSWTIRGLSAGLQVQSDSKLGQVVFLGEEGRGRRYHKVGLSRYNPADVEGGCVLNANPIKISLPAKNGRPEVYFYVLERSLIVSKNILVRINSYGGYIRGGQGFWETRSGNPETIVSGFGAFGDAGRLGTWDDGLVLMHPGDVVKIHPSRILGHGESVLWIDESGLQTASLQDYEIKVVEKKPHHLSHGQMPCFSFSASKNLILGIKVGKNDLGIPIVRVGEEGRGRKLVSVPVLEPPMVPCPNRHSDDEPPIFEKREEEVLEEGDTDAAEVVSVSTKEAKKPQTCSLCGVCYETAHQGGYLAIIHPENKGYVLGPLMEASVVKFQNDLFGLVQSEKIEAGCALLHLSTGPRSIRRKSGSWEILTGSPEVIARGHGADGIAGACGSWDEALIILHEGDVIRVILSWGGPAYMIHMEGGLVIASPEEE